MGVRDYKEKGMGKGNRRGLIEERERGSGRSEGWKKGGKGINVVKMGGLRRNRRELGGGSCRTCMGRKE